MSKIDKRLPYTIALKYDLLLRHLRSTLYPLDKNLQLRSFTYAFILALISNKKEAAHIMLTASLFLLRFMFSYLF